MFQLTGKLKAKHQGALYSLLNEESEGGGGGGREGFIPTILLF